MVVYIQKKIKGMWRTVLTTDSLNSDSAYEHLCKQYCKHKFRISTEKTDNMPVESRGLSREEALDALCDIRFSDLTWRQGREAFRKIVNIICEVYKIMWVQLLKKEVMNTEWTSIKIAKKCGDISLVLKKLTSNNSAHKDYEDWQFSRPKSLENDPSESDEETRVVTNVISLGHTSQEVLQTLNWLKERVMSILKEYPE